MMIIKRAQVKRNNIDQWQNNYPNRQTIKDDILKGYSYVLLNDENIVATTAISFDVSIFLVTMTNPYKIKNISFEMLIENFIQ
ncbi:hypothetical protein NDK43_11820 [Neobacillus pocheonensis]|uniref:Uncharacterized protein n=1 Tax=Neobacillus pocheonensis TaxID=363869 RepID=A0ABT0W9D8_9BACI|nr:hypothetical protein [Neobacillus pocheonensis]